MFNFPAYCLVAQHPVTDHGKEILRITAGGTEAGMPKGFCHFFFVKHRVRPRRTFLQFPFELEEQRIGNIKTAHWGEIDNNRIFSHTTCLDNKILPILQMRHQPETDN
ncbi:MAG: hypothetical protein RBT16_09115, partial [Desulfococcus multivorans]|nr:hypothetical protein [Desulfococcus multivorans]